jgi:hypothetical protein
VTLTPWACWLAVFARNVAPVKKMTVKLRELLSKNDKELFSTGGCHVYAVELKNCWPELKIKHAGNADAIGPTRAMHVYTAVGEFKIDVFGPVIEEQYLASKGYTSWEVSAEELTKIDPSQESANGPLDCWRHHLEPEFVSHAAKRARQHIEQHLPEWRSIVSFNAQH